MFADYGQQFTAQFVDGWTPEGWKRRLAELVRSYSGSCIVKGADSACRDSPKFPPNMRQIEAAVRDLHIQHCRYENAKREALPRFTGGIAGYVEHVLAPNARSENAQKCLKIMQRAVRGYLPMDERADRAADSVARLEDQVQRAIKDGRVRLRANLQASRCAHDGCSELGVLSRGVSGSGPWYCRRHIGDDQ